MPAEPLIHYDLKSPDGSLIASFAFSPGQCFQSWSHGREILAHMHEIDADEIGCDEEDFYTIDGERVATLEVRRTVAGRELALVAAE